MNLQQQPQQLQHPSQQHPVCQSAISLQHRSGTAAAVAARLLSRRHSHPAKPPPQPCCSFLCRCASIGRAGIRPAVVHAPLLQATPAGSLDAAAATAAKRRQHPATHSSCKRNCGRFIVSVLILTVQQVAGPTNTNQLMSLQCKLSRGRTSNIYWRDRALHRQRKHVQPSKV